MTVPSEDASAGRGRLLRKSARNLLRRMRRDAPGGLAGLAKRQPAAESSANNTSRLGVVRYAEQLRAAAFTLVAWTGRWRSSASTSPRRRRCLSPARRSRLAPLSGPMNWPTSSGTRTTYRWCGGSRSRERSRLNSAWYCACSPSATRTRTSSRAPQRMLRGSPITTRSARVGSRRSLELLRAVGCGRVGWSRYWDHHVRRHQGGARVAMRLLASRRATATAPAPPSRVTAVFPTICSITLVLVCRRRTAVARPPLEISHPSPPPPRRARRPSLLLLPLPLLQRLGVGQLVFVRVGRVRRGLDRVRCGR